MKICVCVSADVYAARCSVHQKRKAGENGAQTHICDYTSGRFSSIRRRANLLRAAGRGLKCERMAATLRARVLGAAELRKDRRGLRVQMHLSADSAAVRVRPAALS